MTDGFHFPRLHFCLALAMAGCGFLLSGITLHASALQARIDAADSGDTLILEEDAYGGPLVIEKSINLIGRGAPVIRGDGKSHVIHILAPDVRIEGLHITHSGSNLGRDHAGIMVEAPRASILDNQITDSLHGIYIKKADSCRIERNRITGKTEKIIPLEDVMQKGFRPISAELCAVKLDTNLRGNGIHMWSSRDILVLDNFIEQTRDGIYFSFTDHAYVRGNTVRQVRYGLHYMYSDSNVFEKNLFFDNAAGAALMYSKDLMVRNNTFRSNAGHRAYGLLIQSVDNTVIRENRINRNTVGLFLENSNDNHLSANSIERNYLGVRLTSSSNGNRFSRNQFRGNLHHAEFDQDNSANVWASEDGVGNTWSGSRIMDLDGDGVGEWPHHETNLFGPVRRRFPGIGLLSGSPAHHLLRFMEQKMRLPGIPSLTDPAPTTHFQTEPEPHRD